MFWVFLLIYKCGIIYSQSKSDLPSHSKQILDFLPEKLKECTFTFLWKVPSNNVQFIFDDIEKHKIFTNKTKIGDIFLV